MTQTEQLKQILKENGLVDESIAKVLASMKDGKIFLASEENLDVRYTKLKTDHEGLKTQSDESTKLIEQLKKENAGSKDLQTKVAEYDTKVAELQKQLLQAQIDAELKIKLMEAGAEDIDYLTFKIKEKGELTLGDDGKIKGIDDTIAATKTQFPKQFTQGEGGKKVEEIPLPSGENKGDATPISLAAALQNHYEGSNK